VRWTSERFPGWFIHEQTTDPARGTEYRVWTHDREVGVRHSRVAAARLVEQEAGKR
jgi:hypothetical protein